MNEDTINAFNALVDKIGTLSIGTILAVVLILFLFNAITESRARNREKTSQNKREEQMTLMLGKAMNRDDSETARAIHEVDETQKAFVQTQKAFTAALEKNTAALEQRNQYGEMQVIATQESVNELKALRTDIKVWPDATNAALNMLTQTVKAVQSSVDLLITSADNRLEDTKTILDLLKPIPSQLELIREATQQLLDTPARDEEIFALMRELKSSLPQPGDEKTSKPEPAGELHEC